jgi:hypothetical protein
MTESDLMRAIMIALSAEGHFVARANVGLFYTRDGRPVRSGLPVGFSDLFGHRAGDARAFYLEVKAPAGRVTPEQFEFLAAMRARGAIAAVVRSVDEAIEALA